MALSYFAGKVFFCTRVRRAALLVVALFTALIFVRPGFAQQDQSGGLNIDQIKQILQGHTSSSQGAVGNGDQTGIIARNNPSTISVSCH